MLALTRSKEWVYYNLLCNLVTNPTLNLTLNFVVYPLFGTFAAYRIGVAIGELLVFVGEAHLYRAMSGEVRSKCYMRSLITNGASFLLGLLI